MSIKIFFCFVLISFLNTELLSTSKTLFYEDRFADKKFSHIVKQIQHKKQKVFNIERYSETLSIKIIDNEMQYLHVKSKKADNDFEVKRIGDELNISGTFHGMKIDKMKRIDSAIWSNAPGLTFENFFKSKKQTIRFWIMSTHSLKVIKMRLQKLGMEDVVINKKSMKLLKVTMAPDSWLSLFWRAHLWVHPETGLTYLYKGPNQDKESNGQLEIVLINEEN